jgi:hypothetical protein
MLARGSDRADRWFFATTTRPDSVNFRNAYNTLLTGLLARTVVSAQVDAIPNCDEVQVQPFAIENSQVALYP